MANLFRYVHCRISGRVQGVGFRYYTREEALRLGLTGWVRNLLSGEVEVFASGNEAHIATFLDWLEHGPSHAQVDNLQVDNQLAQSFTEFSILANAND